METYGTGSTAAKYVNGVATARLPPSLQPPRKYARTHSYNPINNNTPIRFTNTTYLYKRILYTVRALRATTKLYITPQTRRVKPKALLRQL